MNISAEDSNPKIQNTKGKKYKKMALLLLFIDLKDRLRHFHWDHPTMFEK
jgi:hypothetical protein